MLSQSNTRTITLTNGSVALIDACDYDSFSRYTWKSSSHGYAMRWDPQTKRNLYMHRQVMGFPRGDVDHANRDRLDNRRANLRSAPHHLNVANHASRPNKTGYRGVMVLRNRAKAKPWGAMICHRGKRMYLGAYATAEEAGRAFDEAAVRLRGPFAVLNFPDESAAP